MAGRKHGEEAGSGRRVDDDRGVVVGVGGEDGRGEGGLRKDGRGERGLGEGGHIVERVVGGERLDGLPLHTGRTDGLGTRAGTGTGTTWTIIC